MNKRRVFRIVIITLIVVFFWVTFPWLYRVYLVAIPGVLVYLLLSKYNFFSDKKESNPNLIDITEDTGWKKRWVDGVSSHFVPVLTETFLIFRKAAIALVIIVLVLGIAYFFVIDGLKMRRTKGELSEISSEINTYSSRNNKFPDSLDDVIARNPLRATWKKDFWDNPIIYTKAPNNLSYILISYGKDGILNTEDDLIVKSN